MIVNLTTGYPLMNGDEVTQLKSLQSQFCSLIDELNFIIPTLGNSISAPISSGSADSENASESEV